MTSETTHDLIGPNGRKITVGQVVKDFRGDPVTIQGWTSGDDWSTNKGSGRVHTDQGNFFPGVIDAKIVPKRITFTSERQGPGRRYWLKKADLLAFVSAKRKAGYHVTIDVPSVSAWVSYGKKKTDAVQAVLSGKDPE